MIADLHCDLLLYLQQNPRRCAFDNVSRCSIPQMRMGGVKLQVLPIFTETGAGSASLGAMQNRIFHALPDLYADHYFLLTSAGSTPLPVDKIAIIRAIENASSFCEETEPLEVGLKKLESLLREGKIAYISLTWNGENRFGGGAHTAKGLKEDGRTLLNFMHSKRVAVDLSHASDQLAYDILDYIDAHKLAIPVIASHSNCRSVMDVARNLPDALIQEIIHRQGLIGLNFVKPFLGLCSKKAFSQHLNHLLKYGGEQHICFGADFFYENDIPIATRRPKGAYFFDGYGSSAAYSKVLGLWQNDLSLTPAQLQQIAYHTLHQFLQKHILYSQ